LAVGLVVSAPTTSAAKDKVRSVNLPGVNGSYRIVKPMPPEPEPTSDDTGQPSGRYGRRDVTISGEWRVDVGAGKLPPSRNSTHQI
jgi:hypothetical protein